ncbi:MAG: Plug and carboxypeptidase regulatory-like domain-containing protein, partial [Acidobacteriota bacterium]|nr:Plug and carboxypeptidase regulatory-like domain-containing protein [Acidobacteriota bacterium]
MLKNKAKMNLLILLIALLFTGISSAFAQSTSATLSGNVKDERDAVVSDATVTVSNTAIGFQRTVTTNESGEFSVPLLPPSTYLVTINRSGFAPFEARDVVLNANDQRSLQVQLKVGAVGATVQVEADANTIKESPAVSTTIDRTFVSNLPLNGRSIQTLISLSPGVVAVPVAQNGGNQGQFSVNGQRTNSNYVTVDGVSGNFSVTNFESLGQNGSGSIPATNIQGGFSNLASVDALQEFTIQTSTFAPEFGRSPGGQISLVTRSGENKFHGNLFEYVRNDVFDARDFFDARKPALRFNNFGGTFGGPVVIPGFGEGTPLFHVLKDKTFFFFSYEGQRFLLPQPTITTTVPSLAARQNAPNEVARAILNAFPLPNGAEIRNAAGALTGGALFSTTFSNPTNSDAWGVRLDHNINKNFTLFGRYNYSPSESKGRSTSSTSNPSSFSVNTQKTEKLILGSTQVISTKLVNEIRADSSRQEGLANSGFDGFGGGVLPPTSIFLPEGLGTQRRYSFFPVTDVFGTYTYGDVVKNENRQLQFVDNLSYNIGSHQLKFGGDYRRLTPTVGANDLIESILTRSLQNVYN